MAVTPSTNIRLLKVPLEIDNRNQITFSNVTAQYNYFHGLTDYLELDEARYLRKDSVIRYDGHIDTILEYNYCMYQNENYTNKWFYAYITRMEYINDHCTYIYIKTDVFQTWQFDLTYKPSFIEREHVNDDTIGLHTIPEGLETGDYTLYSIKTGYSGLHECHVVMGTTVNPANVTNQSGREYGGIFSGIKYYIFKTYTDLQNAITNLASLGKSDAIKTLFLAPDELTGYDTATWTTESNINYSDISTSQSTSLNNFTLFKPIKIGTYTPKNSKVLCYPYNYFIMSNNCGESALYHYEDFETEAVTFKVFGTITPSCSIRAIPYKYKHQTNEGLSNDDLTWYEGISCGKFPQCSWDKDLYTNWAVQNQANIKLGLTQQGVNMGLGMLNGLTQALSGNVVGGVSNIIESPINGFMGIQGVMAQIEQHSIIPPTADGNINNGDITYAKSKLHFEAYPVQIREEIARCIDEYFSMYGYKINRVKNPNITGRSNWNFVKTIGINIEAYIPQEDLQEIKDMFNNGLTLWHTTQYFLDYSRSNNIV